jgi:hypothetical protein
MSYIIGGLIALVIVAACLWLLARAIGKLEKITEDW